MRNTRKSQGIWQGLKNGRPVRNKNTCRSLFCHCFVIWFHFNCFTDRDVVLETRVSVSRRLETQISKSRSRSRSLKSRSRSLESRSQSQSRVVESRLHLWLPMAGFVYADCGCRYRWAFVGDPGNVCLDADKRRQLRELAPTFVPHVLRIARRLSVRVRYDTFCWWSNFCHHYFNIFELLLWISSVICYLICLNWVFFIT